MILEKNTMSLGNLIFIGWSKKLTKRWPSTTILKGDLKLNNTNIIILRAKKLKNMKECIQKVDDFYEITKCENMHKNNFYETYNISTNIINNFI